MNSKPNQNHSIVGWVVRQGALYDVSKLSIKFFREPGGGGVFCDCIVNVKAWNVNDRQEFKRRLMNGKKPSLGIWIHPPINE